jgi:hypothetical protein
MRDTIKKLDLILPMVDKIGEQMKQISKVLGLKDCWIVADFFYKTDGKKSLIDEFRLRKLTKESR